ncbi:phosphoenolpyruvate-dependent sugar phosphotransferase system, EIIA 2 domain protein [Treponema primitia ZAS-2]|uniref:Phosphoenolpyruvate-dependent sugar phosphotransferase system, EIIA 2 domain protein n=1 Tax=Treponema primitia (strain ATCC BAA-887 / DSM 12427 / ZAS-2) TaxID=545694 RepID=F5YH60_TREPZ|nr:PTS sugar transporter subunit IIA [Treponema primitia]AEF84360.1 phosphoenolpyruvate-dependent sugar phosphotransferase system, EIIA 2 domain protein [Treponema primitia ZAS-2]
MLLHEIFSPEFILVDLESSDKEEVFEELVDRFCQVIKSNARDDILEALKEREVKMSTGIQRGIAIPHGKTHAVDKVYGMLGISRKGIDYEALDGNPVYLLFMIVGPPTDSEKHLHVLQGLAELLTNPQFFLDIAAQKDVQSVYGVLKKYEDTLITLN